MKLIRVELVPLLRYGWLVYVTPYSGNPATLDYFEKKTTALLFARRVAKQLNRSTLRIHDRRGRFQEERTYPKKLDPKRSKG